MRLIPGKTKVQLELFRGVTLGDVLIGGVALFMLIFVLTSNLAGKIYFAIGIVVLAAGLLARLDTEANYRYLLRIIRHYGYKRNFLRPRDASDAEAGSDFPEENIEMPEPPLSKAELKARKKAEKAERKADDKLLKSKKVSEEEKDAIWLKRAQQSAAKKKAKGARKAAGGSGKADPMENITAFTDIQDGMIVYGKKYYGAVLEIPPVEFRFLSDLRRANSIENGLGRVLRNLPADYAANIVKIERPVMYDAYLENEYRKLDVLRTSYENGVITEEEMKIRVEVLYDRINELLELCNGERIIQPFFYLVLFDSDRQQLNSSARTALDQLRNAEMKPHRLNSKELAVFLRYSNQLDFDEREIETVAPQDYAKWAMPNSVRMTPRTTVVNGILTHNMHITNYPTIVGDAWLATVMSLPATKVVVKCTPMDRFKAIRSIDRSLTELRGQYATTGVDSKRMELQQHIESLGGLLATLQSEAESLLEVNVYITAYDINLTRSREDLPQPPASSLANISNMKRLVRRTYQEQGFRLNNMEFDQVNAYIGGQISAWDPLRGKGRGIPSNTVAATYPWVFAHVSDPNGVKLGSESGVPVFIDFFRRDSERVNSNMVIVGKSGSGKSYAAKSLLANLAADDAKIFILDPENEYTELANTLHGKFINVGNAQYGRLNPFHIITALDDDEAEAGVSGSYATHLQFLEEFFKQIMPDCDKDAMEYLNSLVDRMYTNMGITAETNLSLLRPEDYPTFDNLYDAVLSEFQSTDSEYIRSMLRTLMNYVAKFAGGGRNANIWNGPSTVTTEENFTVFNFQSLLANRNGTIANAQMLLVLKYIDNEIIKNRDYNLRYGLHRKIVVVIDEAHVFIDTKFPVALDFMFQLAKRIRKYNGMQIVITQNIKDFVGSEEIARKSTAIINACQYSFIFPLAPNDMGDLCTLYEKAGGINENEQEKIISAGRGQAFTIMSPQSRSAFKVEVPDDVRAMFHDMNYVSRYFSDEDGAENWENFIQNSREKREANLAARKAAAPAAEEKIKRHHVVLQQVSEEELAADQIKAPAKSGRVKPEQVSAADFDALDDFDIPEIPENMDDFLAMRAAAAETPAAPAVPVPTPAPAAAFVTPTLMQAATSGSTEDLLGVLGKFSYEAMMEEIRRSVREEVEREKRSGAAAVPTPAVEEMPAPVEEAPQSTALGSIFNPEAMEEAARLDAEEAAAYAEPVPAEDEGPLDIMALLAAEASAMDTISPIDMMEEYQEEVVQITLEELIAYNAQHK